MQARQFYKHYQQKVWNKIDEKIMSVQICNQIPWRRLLVQG